jgi:hypothetical protein
MTVQRCLDCDRLIERVPNGRLCGKCLRTDIRPVPSLEESVRYPAGVRFDDEGAPDRTPVSEVGSDDNDSEDGDDGDEDGVKGGDRS